MTENPPRPHRVNPSLFSRSPFFSPPRRVGWGSAPIRRRKHLDLHNETQLLFSFSFPRRVGWGSAPIRRRKHLDLHNETQLFSFSFSFPRLVGWGSAPIRRRKHLDLHNETQLFSFSFSFPRRVGTKPHSGTPPHKRIIHLNISCCLIVFSPNSSSHGSSLSYVGSQ
jgi:hypothetical protein